MAHPVAIALASTLRRGVANVCGDLAVYRVSGRLAACPAALSTDASRARASEQRGRAAGPARWRPKTHAIMTSRSPPFGGLPEREV